MKLSNYSLKHLVRAAMTTDLQDDRHSDIEEKKDPGVDVDWPVMLCVEDEVMGGIGGAVARPNDILQAKQSACRRGRRERGVGRGRPIV